MSNKDDYGLEEDINLFIKEKSDLINENESDDNNEGVQILIGI